MITSIIDIFHGNEVDWDAAVAGGITAVIHKATQGLNFTDSQYVGRRAKAKELGLLWGAYHFATGDSVAGQVEHFLAFAKPEDDELIALDFEPNTSGGPTMTIAQAREFVEAVKDKTGRFPVVYGGHLIREAIGQSHDPVLANCPLWYVRIAATPIGIPTQVWPDYTLWQYTDGDSGIEPVKTPGVQGADRNMFKGTVDDLKAAWPFTFTE